MLCLQQTCNRTDVVPTASSAGTSLAVAAAVPRSGVSNTNRPARSPVRLAAKSDYQSSKGHLHQHKSALPDAPVQHSTQQAQHQGPGIESFKALIAERRFTCTQCGKCCTGDGEVWIAPEEAERIAAHLGLSVQRFLQRCTRATSKVAGFRQLKAKKNPTQDCIFLQPDNTCSIHLVRPLQCSTYPWWPDLMTEYDWDWEKQNICEGFDHPDAPPTDTDEAARQLRAATALEYRLMLAHKSSRKQAAAADVAATAGLAGTLPEQQVPQVARQQATCSHTYIYSGGNQAHSPSSSSSSSSGSSSSGKSESKSRSNCNYTSSIDNNGEPQPRAGQHDSHHKDSDTGTLAHPPVKWQQRLSRLQELANVDDQQGQMPCN